ncbi:MAG: glycosyltransferase, partial [Anaerolineales bacterium]
SVGLLAYLTASTNRLPLIYTYHTSITDCTHYLKFIGGTRLIKYGAAWFSSTTTNLGDQIVVPSPKFQRLLIKQKVRKPIHVIPNGIDLSNFKTAKHAGALRNRLKVSADAPILLTVGRMDPEKRLDFIVDAFVKISKQIPNVQLVFAGDGSARKKLEEKVNALDIKNKIHFLGMVNRNELPDVLHDATLFLSASTTEVHPISVIEAIASGLPLVAVNDEAFEGMIENDRNGYLTPLDVNVYAETIIKVLQDNKKIETFGKHSTHLSEKYSIEGQVKALEKLYTEAILQNWRGNFISRMIPKEIKDIPNQLNRLLPGRSKKK